MKPADTIALPERLTLDEAGATLVRLGGALSQQAGAAVTVGADALQEFDSSALAVLLELRRQLSAQGRALRVEGWPPRLKELASLYGVHDLLAS